MAKAIVNDVWLRTTAGGVVKHFVQEIDAARARAASLAVELKSVEFDAEEPQCNLQVTLLGSNNQATWFPVSTTLPDLTFSTIASGPSRVGGEAKAATFVDLKAWRWLRVEYEMSLEAAQGVGTADLFFSSILNVE